MAEASERAIPPGAQKCENCLFWKEVAPSSGTTREGLCRRYALPPQPVVGGLPAVMIYPAWPRCTAVMWCGDWKDPSLAVQALPAEATGRPPAPAADTLPGAAGRRRGGKT